MKRASLTLALALLPAVALAQSAPPKHAASNHEAPYARLASDLETPKLTYSQGPKDKSLLKLRYVGDGQTDATWEKMTSISIAKVRPEDTTVATRSIIAKFKSDLESDKKAKVSRFDEKLLPSQNAYFEFHSPDGVAEQGIAYSPAAGFVSVIQVAYKHGYTRAAIDRGILKSLLNPGAAPPTP